MAEANSSTTAEAKSSKTAEAKVPMKKIVLEALGQAENPRTGMAFQGVKSYIARKHPDIALKPSFKSRAKNCLLTALEKGEVKRSKKSEECTGVHGSFTLPVKKAAKTERKSRKRSASPGTKKAERLLSNSKSNGKPRSKSDSPGKKSGKVKKRTASQSPSAKVKVKKPKFLSPSKTPTKAKKPKARSHSKSPGKAKTAAKAKAKPKEVEIINNVRDLLQNTLAQTDKQIRLNRDCKHNLEMDWSDKKEALDIDSNCAALRHHHTNKQFHDGAAKFEEIQSTPESWAQFTHDNIARAEHERMASLQLSTLIDNVLDDTSRDMHEQCDAVDVSLQERLAEVQDAKAKLEENLRKVCKEIADQEKNIDELKAAIRALEDPLKKAQERLHQRSSRPGVDLCRDPAQYALVAEVNEICQSMDALKNQLNQAENSLKDLQDNRMALEKEIQVKNNSIFIDRDKVMTVRTRYPSITKLLGYQ